MIDTITERVPRSKDILKKFPTLYMDHFTRIEGDVAGRRNYLIHPEVNHSIGKLDMFLVNKRGSVNLREFMPNPTYGLLEGSEFKHVPQFKVVFYDRKAIKNKGFILSLLHEMGHANVYKEPPRDPKLNKYENLLKVNNSLRYFFARKLSRLTSPKGFTFDRALDDLFGLNEINLLPSDAKTKFFSHMVRQERDAWAFALKVARKLEKKGFNILGEFENKEEILQYVKYNLATYEFVKQFGEKATGSYTPLSRKLQFIR